MLEHLIFSIEKHVGLITLNRPAALNALTHPMIFALHAQLQAWEADTSIHAIVIQAVDGRAFCAGGDVRAVYESGRHTPLAALSFFRDEYRLNYFIHGLKKPYIALMDGLTLGGVWGFPCMAHTRWQAIDLRVQCQKQALAFFLTLDRATYSLAAPTDTGRI